MEVGTYLSDLIIVQKLETLVCQNSLHVSFEQVTRFEVINSLQDLYQSFSNLVDHREFKVLLIWRGKAINRIVKLWNHWTIMKTWMIVMSESAPVRVILRSA